MDSNHRSRRRRIYSPLHLAALQPFHINLILLYYNLIILTYSKSICIIVLIKVNVCSYNRSKSIITLELVKGIEPPTCWLQISCSANWATPAFGLFPTPICFHVIPHILRDNVKLVPWGGIEPPTGRFSVCCSTDWATKASWRPKTGSNRRPPAWQAGALTNWAIGPFAMRLKQRLLIILYL